METLEIIEKRKSCRDFSDREIDAKTKEKILHAASQAPTAGNMALYSIIDITDQSLKEKLSQTCDHQDFIAQAKMVLIFCADYQRWYDAFSKNIETVRKPGNGDLFLAMNDCIIAAQTAALAAESLGVSSCYIGDILENYETHKQLLKLPKYVLPVTMLVFGYGDEKQEKREKTKHFSYTHLVHENSYQASEDYSLESMLDERSAMNEEQKKEWIRRFCERKWNCDFSKEMTRSVDEMLKEWNK